MIRKYLYLLLALPLVASSFQSCIKDESHGPSGNLSKLSLAQNLQEKCTLNRWDTLKISPNVVQTNEQEKIDYEWEVNGKVVSTDASFKYVCKDFGIFLCQLKVSNGNNIQYYELGLNVQYSYVDGLYILASNSGETIVSYLPKEGSTKTFDLDVLQKDSPSIDFAGEPKGTDYTLARDNKTPLLLVAVGSPSTIYEFDGNLINMRFTTNSTGDVTYLRKSALTYPESMLTMVNYAPNRLILSETTSFNLGKSIKDALGSGISLADAATAWKQQDLCYVQGYVMLDNAEGRLVAQKVQATGKVPVELLKGRFTDETLVSMEPVDNERNIVLLTWNATSSKFKCYYIFPGFYPSTATRVEAAVVKDGAVVSATAGLTTQSVIRVSVEKNLVYYSVGSKLYAYNVLSGGNFPQSTLTIFGDSSETIVDMFILEGSNKLYVATNTASGQFVGSIYCFDMNENKLLWAKKNITGCIKNITYRQ